MMASVNFSIMGEWSRSKRTGCCLRLVTEALTTEEGLLGVVGIVLSIVSEFQEERSVKHYYQN